MNIIDHTKQVFTSVSKHTNKIILFYSCGKDSIALLDLASQYFEEVVCVFMYFVKDLEHINKYINWSKSRYANVKFIEVPHWNLTYLFRSGLYCHPQPNIKILKLIDIDDAIRLKTGIKWSMFGMKKADGMNRNIMLRAYTLEAINEATKKAYPLSLWKDKEVLRYIELNRLPSPIDYEAKKRSSGVGFDLDVFLYLRKNYPSDLQKILTQFPMAGRILFDHDRKQSKL